MAETDLLAPPGPIPPDKLAAALEARRQRLAGLNASPAAVGLDQKLAQLRAMRTGLAFTAARATPETLYQPQPAEATAVAPVVPPGAGSVPPPALSRVTPAQNRLNVTADRLAEDERAAGRVRAVVPGAEPASIVERAVGRAASHLPGTAGEWGARTAAMGERHGQEEAVGRESLPFLAKLPADIANLYLELEAGARIPGPIGRTIGEGYHEPIMGNLAGELEAPGLAATVGRVLRTGGREGARFATLEGVKGAVQQDPAEQVIADALAGGASGLAWGTGAQLAREALARAVAAGLRSKLGRAAPYPRPLVTTGREVPNEPPAAPAAALPPGVPPAAPDAPNAPPTESPLAPTGSQPVAPSPVNVEAFKDEIASGKYTDRELKQLRAQFLANAGPALRPPQDPVTRVVDAIDTHLQAKGVAGAAPIEPAPPVGAVQGEPDAIHDEQGNVVPGSEVSNMDPRAAAERRAQAGGPPAGTPERRRAPVFAGAESYRRPGAPASAATAAASELKAPETPINAPRGSAPTHPDVIPEGTPSPATVVRIPTASVIADPARFQFKALGKEGVGGELKGVRTFNPNLAGVISVWRDPASHKTYVVNGHHRLELAKRTGQPELNAQFLDAPDATTARALGALINIAEGRGTATDVAKFLRDGNVTPEELDKHGVSIKGDLAKDGVALSRLAPDVFDQVATGKVPQNWGTAIGAVLDDPVLQREALKAARGARTNLTGAEVSEVARQVQAAGTETTTQATLFGSEKQRHGLYVQKAQVVAAIKKRLATDKRLFGFIAKEGRAAQLERAGTTQIDVGAAKDIAAVSARAEEIFDRLYTRTGPLATIVNEAARRTTHGEPVAAVVTDIYPQVRAAVEREVAGTGLGVARAGGQEHPTAGGTRSLADEEAGRTEKPVTDSQDEAQAGLGVAEPVVQDDFFGKPKAVEAEHQGELLGPTAGTRPAALPQTKIQTPEEIARVRREGAEPAGATPGELFAQGEQSAVAKAAQQIAEAVKAALPQPAPTAPKGRTPEQVARLDARAAKLVAGMPPGRPTPPGGVSSRLAGIDLDLEPTATLESLRGLAQSALDAETSPAMRAMLEGDVAELEAAIAARAGGGKEAGRIAPPTSVGEPNPAMEPGPRLSVLHNLSAENLIAADKLGGFPAPSLAIVPEKMGLEGYGGITLIGKRELADPTQTPIYDADAYTGQNPRPEYPSLRQAPAQRFVDQFKAVSDEFNDHRVRDEVWDQLVNRKGGPDPAEIEHILERSSAARALYLRQQGVVVKPRMHAVPLYHPLSKNPVLQAFFKQHGVDVNARPDTPYWRAFSKALTKAISEHAKATYGGKPDYADLVKMNRDALMGRLFGPPEGRDEALFGVASHLLSDQRNIGKREVDRYASEDALKKATPDEGAFTAWVKAQVAPLLGTPFLRQGGRKVPYNLENVARGTVASRNAQDNMTFGPGAARAAGSRRIPDLAWLRNAVEANVRPAEEVDAARKAIEQIQDDWRSEIVKYYRPGDFAPGQFGQVWEGLDAAHRAIGRWLAGSMRNGATAHRLGRELAREGFRSVPQDALERGVEVATALRDAAVPYFEGKPPRAVTFDEFAGAVVPEKDLPAVQGILERRGLPFTTYKGEENQVEATRAFRQELEGQGTHTLLEPVPKYAPRYPSALFLHEGKYDTPERQAKLERDHLRATFGSDAAARTAAVTAAMNVGRLAQYDLFGVPDPLKLDTAQREAAVRRATAPKVWVTITGQATDTPEQLHRLLAQFRDPTQENMHFVLRAGGQTVAHQMHTSGVINQVKMQEGFANDIIADCRAAGADEVVLAHNHPSGDPTMSDMDLMFTQFLGEKLAAAGIKLVGHLTTNGETGMWLTHHGDRYTTRRIRVPREGAQPPDWTDTQGPQILMPEMVMDLVSSRGLPAGRVDVLHVDNSMHAVALEPHSLAALDRINVWLGERRRALATTSAFVVVGDEAAYRRAVNASASLDGVADVLLVSQAPEGHYRVRSARAEGLHTAEPHITRPPGGVPRTTQVLERAVRPAGGIQASEEHSSVAEPPPTGPIGSAADDLDDVPLPEAAGLGTRGTQGFSPSRLLGALRAVFNPESLGPRAKETASAIRAGRAVGAQELARAQHDLRTLSRLVGKLDKKQSLRLWDAAEHWGEPGTRETVEKLGIPPAMLDTFEATTEKFSAELERLDILEPTIAHYVGRYWAGPPNEVQSFLARIFGKRPLEGPKTFKKQRSHDLFADGLRAGLTPMTYNFVDSQMLKFTEMQRAINGRRMVNEELEAGRAKKVMLGDDPPQDVDGEWTRIGDGRDPAFTIYGPRDVALGGEYVPAQTDLMQAGGAIDRVPVFGRRIMGHFYAPPQSAAVWNNALSRGLRGNPIYDALMAPGQAAAQMILGLSGFHGAVISQEAMFSELALGRLPQAAGVAVRGVTQGRRIMQEYQSRGAHPELARVLDAMIQGGFRATRQSEFWTGDRRARFKAALRDALHGPGLMRRVSGATRVPFDAVWAAIEGASFPTMGFYVPHQKAFATYVAVERALAKLPPGTAIEEVRRVMGDVVKEMDYRFGQVMYDNHFINNVAKDLAQLIFLAPGWTGGTLQLAGRGVRQAARLGRQAVGGAKDEPPIGTSSLRYWLAAFAGLAIFNGILTYLLTGEPPHDKDFLAFRDGTQDAQGNANRFRLPGYIMHDLYSWTHHPVRTLGNKLSPGLHWVYAIGSNRTYQGDEVYDPNADPATVMSQIAAYTVESNLPISVQNIAEARHRGEHGVMGVVPGLVGVSPAPREFVRSPAQNLLAEYAQHGAPSGATPEEAAQRRLRNDVMDRFHRRELDYSGVRAELRAGGLTDAQVKDALRDVLAPPLQTRFKQLTLEQARAVYDLGTPEEKRVWGPALFAKIAKAHPRNPPHAPQPPRRR